jgi:hypothetical protein
MTPAEAGEVVGLLLSSYPTQRQRMTREDAAAMTRAYASALQDLDAAAARTAVSALVLTESWIPTIAAIRLKAAEHAGGRRRSSGEAWGDVVDAMRRYGSHRAPGVDFTFGDPLVGDCVRRLGWRDLCASENQVADRAHFMRMYDDVAEPAERDRATAGAIASTSRVELPAGVHALVAGVTGALTRGGSS